MGKVRAEPGFVFGTGAGARGAERRGRPKTGTPVLYATYRQELADAVEMMPEAVFLARRREDERRAEKMTALHRAVLERMDFEEVYIRLCESRARLGVGYCEIQVRQVSEGDRLRPAGDPGGPAERGFAAGARAL